MANVVKLLKPTESKAYLRSLLQNKVKGINKNVLKLLTDTVELGIDKNKIRCVELDMTQWDLFMYSIKLKIFSTIYNFSILPILNIALKDIAGWALNNYKSIYKILEYIGVMAWFSPKTNKIYIVVRAPYDTVVDIANETGYTIFIEVLIHELTHVFAANANKAANELFNPILNKYYYKFSLIMDEIAQNKLLQNKRQALDIGVILSKYLLEFESLGMSKREIRNHYFDMIYEIQQISKEFSWLYDDYIKSFVKHKELIHYITELSYINAFNWNPQRISYTYQEFYCASEVPAVLVFKNPSSNLVVGTLNGLDRIWLK